TRLVAGQQGLVIPFIPARRDGARSAEPEAPVEEPATVREARAGTVYDGRADEESAPAQAAPPRPGPSVLDDEEPIAAVSTPNQEIQDILEERDNQRLVPTQRDTGPDDEPSSSLVSRLIEPDHPDVPELDIPDLATRETPAVDSPTQVELDLRPDIPVRQLPEATLGDQDPGRGDDDPIDEPPPQLVPPADAALVAGLETNVMVVDGRPRYHLVTCVHLLGREVDALPVREAIELGFTPCSLCEPDTPLLAQARRT
ncbi:MAG TPA: hypothetical protein VJT31_14690, partial [Rugosimonospora sp.]|nr:hypothetical protein [Rugosimonospora sp.]